MASIKEVTSNMPSEKQPNSSVEEPNTPGQLPPNTINLELPKPKKQKLTKAQKKAIAAQKLIELKSKMLRDHLTRELEFTNKSIARGFDDWSNMCKNIKSKQLLHELEEMQQEVGRVLDRKNYRIQFLLRTLNVAEEQHQRNFSQHYKTINYLMLLCKHFAEAMKNLYESHCLELIDTFHMECKNRNDYQQNIQNSYENLIHAVTTMTMHYVSSFDGMATAKKEDLINTNIAKQYLLRGNTVKKITLLRKQLDQVIDELKKDTINARPQEEYDNLMLKQKFHEDDFIKQTKIAEAGYETIYDLQSKLTKLETDSNYRIQNLQLERNYFIEVYWNLKDKVKRHTETIDTEIQELAMESFETIEKFKKLIKFGELLLNLSTSCRKLQTEKEKILPFEIKDPNESYRSTIYYVDYASKDIAQLELLQNFTNRASRAETHVILLKENKAKLMKENECYCNIIRNCYETEALEKIMRKIKVSEYLSVLKEEGRFS